MRVTELMRREPSPHTRLGRGARKLLRAEDDSHWRPAVTPRITHDSAPTLGEIQRLADL